MKRNIYLLKIKTLFIYCSFFLFFLTACSIFAYALYMAEVPEKVQTKIEQPIEREIQLKLPLEQPFFHWKFLSRSDLLSGKLILQIKRNDSINIITIFNNGKFSDGWEAMLFDFEDAIGEVYFGFISSNKYLTSPKDEVEIELTVTKNLDGIGRLQKGILKAGVYKSKGKFVIFNELLQSQTGQAQAFLETWEKQWPLIITSEEGWLPQQKAAKLKEEQKLLLEQSKDEANINIAKTDITENIPSALGLYKLDVGKYPIDLQQFINNSEGCENWKGPYYRKLPKDPWGNPYAYFKSKMGDYIELYSIGPDGAKDTEDDIKNRIHISDKPDIVIEAENIPILTNKIESAVSVIIKVDSITIDADRKFLLKGKASSLLVSHLFIMELQKNPLFKNIMVLEAKTEDNIVDLKLEGIFVGDTNNKEEITRELQKLQNKLENIAKNKK